MEKSPTKSKTPESISASYPELDPKTFTERLEKARQEVESMTDRLDLGIDPDIKEPVAVFIASGFHTTMSCEGHAEKERNPVPYIGIAAPDEPEWEYVGQRELCEKLGAENGLTAEEVLHMFSEDPEKRDLARKVGKQAWDQIDAPFTPEYAEWKAKCDEMAEQVKILLNKFYHEHQADEDARLVIEEMSFGHTRVRNNSPWYEKYFNWASARKGEDLSEEEREQVAERLPVYKKEMGEFAEYIQQMNALAEYDAMDKPSIARDMKAEQEKDLYGQYTQELKLTKEDLGKRVLDVGSDYGSFAIEAKKRGYKDIYSIDLVHPADRYTIDEKIEYGAGKMALADVMRMPFKDEEFDLTVSFCSMPAVLAFNEEEDRKKQTAKVFRQRTKAALLEMLRVTKRGGEVRLGRTFQKDEDDDMPFTRFEETQKVLDELKRELGVGTKTEKISDHSLLIRLTKK